MTRSLTDWLDYQQRIHPAGIALGLDRVRVVADRLGIERPARNVVTVAGTNGKGSTVVFIESIARQSGYRVGAYTSPHLRRYNERVRIDGIDVDDAGLVAAFERIEAVRGDTALTYFEFGTLAALLLFEQAGLDLAVLEVGLGGRLDAVNIVDPDVAVITTVALDHMDWLGPDREAIGREKAGVLRPDRPAVLGEVSPPASVLQVAREIGARCRQAGVAFHCEPTVDGGFRYRDGGIALSLPAPALVARCQPDNACTAIAALRALGDVLPIAPRAWAAGVGSAHAPGRLQRIIRGGVEYLLDVAHNPQAAGELGEWLATHPASGSTQAVFSALGDKDIPQLVAPLRDRVDCWRLGGLGDQPRGLSAQALQQRLSTLSGAFTHSLHDDIAGALVAARLAAAAGDRIVVFGSFLTVAAALDWLACVPPIS